MNDPSLHWPYPDLAKFEVVALGCHRKLHTELAEFLKEGHGIEAFQLVEYFFDEPVRRDGEPPNMICFPFLRRLLDQNVFQLRGEDGSLEIEPLTSDLREDVELEKIDGMYRPRRYVVPFSMSILGQGVYKTWSSHAVSDRVPADVWFQDYSVDQWDEHERLVRQAPGTLSEMYLVEFNLVGRFWKACADGIATIVGAYPICSEETCYGYFAVLWPEPPSCSDADKQPSWGNVRYEDITTHLAKHAKEHYVPTLALLHNSIWEDGFNRVIGDDLDADELTKQIDALPVDRWSAKAEDPIERGLASLWEKRKKLLQQPGGIATVKDTLLFRKYNIASPGMVDEIRKVIQRAPHFRQPDEPGAKLPAALVYGEAGAGKDTMARLIQLFTLSSWRPDKQAEKTGDPPLGYFGLKPHTINMSALKPNALFGPLFQGMNLSAPHLNVPSILTLYDNPNGGEAGGNNAGVFIFDELNSLDAELQGVLLRILENGEVTPLFDIKHSDVGHLIIGVVNEDPEILMRESDVANLKQMKGFLGEFIGNALYEFSTKGRRLRPDLFYRLSRGLYVRLPSLRERRDDIPILFYFECENAVRQELKNAVIDQGVVPPEPWESRVSDDRDPYVYIEMQAYESLMLRSLDWPGNVRQLQTVAMEVAVESVRRYVGKGSQEKPGIVYVQDEIVREVLSHHFRNV